MNQDFDQNELKNELKRIAGSVIYSRGVDYYRDRAVESIIF